MEVQKTWRVSFTPSPTCRILGEMLTSLKFNAELAGFAFTTANDIETRTLPLLSAAAATYKFKAACAGGEYCCRVDAARGIDDRNLGCQARTLAAYCGWKEADVAAGLIETGSRDAVVKAYAVREKAVAKCVDFGDPTSLKAKSAYLDWTSILDRNYKHHEKARNMKSGQKDTAVRYKDGTAVPKLKKVTQLAPIRLINIVEPIPDSVDAADFEKLREEMRGWNMVRACSCACACYSEARTCTICEHGCAAHSFPGRAQNNPCW